MTDARAAILARVRHALGREPGQAPAPRPQPGAIAVQEAQDLERRLVERLASTGVSLMPLHSREEIPAAVIRYREQHGLDGPVAVAPALAALDWRGQPVVFGSARPDHALAVGEAFAAVAATGSLALLADPQHPPRLAFLPEHHLLVLSRRRLLANLERLWVLLAEERRDSEAIHLVTGPSSTADIGGQLLYGAHGPRAVRVFLTP